MSSPEYAVMRGIPGTAVAAKAQLYDKARKRSLLFFLQSLSLKDGLRKVARNLIERFPKLVGEFESYRRASDKNDRDCEEELAHMLVEFCVNPQFIVRFSDNKTSLSECGSMSCSAKLADVLRDFQDRYEFKVRSEYVLTTIGREAFETLDHALDIGKMVVIEGESGSGKTTAAEAWCAAHQGALLDYRIPSDEALQRAFETHEKRRTFRVRHEAEWNGRSSLQRSCRRVARTMHR
jgi:ABC-type glutathione transport system ATPase component